MNFFHINARIVRRVGFAAATLGIVIASSPMTFAAGPNGPGPNGPGNGGSKFQLTNLTVSALKNSSQTFDLMVTVDQTGADGSSSTKYFHSFPSTLYIQLVKNGQVVNSTPYSAALITPGNPGITYKPGTHHDVSGTAEYQLTLPSGTSVGQKESLRIFSPPAPNSQSPNAQYTFRMGIASDPLWSDDVVSGTGTVTSTLPYGQLPEVPFAVGIPLVGVAASGVIWRLRRKSANPSFTQAGKIG
ncbi:MAG TPA: hypothetical protein DD856_18625 [Sulfobacillus sp.]|nr:hypothetical protein [Sulfobacillus sp.]